MKKGWTPWFAAARILALLLALLLALPLAACRRPPDGNTTPGDFTPPPGEDLPGTEPGQLPLVRPESLSGNIIIAGSSTVYPLAEELVLNFKDEGFPGDITVASIGSGAGFERFCVTGEIDIAAASRPVEEAEIDACRAIGRTPVEFRIGTDALAVVVDRENQFVDNLTLEQLALAFTTARTWADLDPSWPDEPIQRFSPGTDSGTFDYFVEEVLGGEVAPMLDAANLQQSEDDNVLVQGVAGSPYGIGYFGYAFYEENIKSVRAVPVEGVEPSAATTESGEYPLARPLYFYSDPHIMQAKPQVAGFINYTLSYVHYFIDEAGYFAATQEMLEASKQRWLDVMGGQASGDRSS